MRVNAFVGFMGASALLIGGSTLYAQPTASTSPLRHAFIENKGQWPAQVMYLTRQPHLDAWITTDGIVYDFYRLHHTPDAAPSHMNLPPEPERVGHVVALHITTSESNQPKPQGLRPLPTYYNYFLGNNPEQWASYVRLYEEVVIKEVADGIHIRHYYDGKGLRFDFVLDPGVEAQSVGFRLEGTDEWTITDGQLTFATRFGHVSLGELFAYQEIDGRKQEVACRFIRKPNGEIGFEVGEYDPRYPLVIDPLLYSTFLGGSNFDFSWDLEVDTAQYAYVVGFSYSSNFPTTPGAYDRTHNGNYDVTVTKLNTTGSNIVFSTFIGGSSTEYGLVIDVDSSYNIYVSGSTQSSNFPTTSGAYDRTHNGGKDAFVTKLNNTGAALIFSTYIGGNSHEEIYTIKLDAHNNVYIGGYTGSANYPTTPGAYDRTFNGVHDAIFTKFDPSGQSLIFSTLLGGSDTDHIHSVRILPSGNYFFSGHTASSDYPTTPGAYDRTYNGNHDAFLGKFNADASALLLSTYIGGSGREESYFVRSTPSEEIIISGFTTSADFPTAPDNTYDTSYNGVRDGFILKMDTNNNLLFSTYIGGSSKDEINGIYVDSSGYIYFDGSSTSADFPTTPGAYDRTYNGGEDVIFGKLSPGGYSLIYSSYIGGTSVDRGISLDVDIYNYVYIAGYTASTNYPTTPGAYDPSHNGGIYDGFVTKFGTPALPVEWIDFTARIVEEGVQLEWQTASEHNSRAFIVERRNDHSPWEAIAEVAAAGTSQTIRKYHYLDRTPLPGVAYYRLRQEDLDGTVSYSVVRRVNYTVKKAGRWQITAPSPHLLLIEHDGSEQLKEVVIRSLDGRVIQRFTPSGGGPSHTFSLDLPKGAYFIEIHSPRDVTVVKWIL